jgi:cytochrome bd-type quinol oxidase subunit 2
MTYSHDLSVVWVLIIAFAILAYVVMDGFDLGIGILFPTLAVGPERDQAMNSVAPVWDGNETWLILGGGGLMAAFPLAYSNSAGAIPSIARTGMRPSRSGRSSRRWRKASRSARSCRAYAW